MMPPPPGQSHSACTTTEGSAWSREVACSVKPTAVSQAIIASASAKDIVCQNLVSAAVMVSACRRGSPEVLEEWELLAQPGGGRAAGEVRPVAGEVALVGVPALVGHTRQRLAPEVTPRRLEARAPPAGTPWAPARTPA